MPIAPHIARSLARTLSEERSLTNLFLISGMPSSGKTTLVRTVFNDLSYVDLNDIYPRNLAHTQPKDFFSVYGNRLIVDGIENAPDLVKFLPDDNQACIVLVGYLPKETVKSLEENKELMHYSLPPVSQREYAGKSPDPFGKVPQALRISYPQPGFFDLMRNGFLPRTDLSLSTAAFYENWLAQFFARHVRGVLNVYKDTLFFNYLKVLATNNMEELNHSKFAKEAGISYATAIYWTDFLMDCGVLFEIPSLKLEQRRQVKRSKFTFADTGLLCFLLGCATAEEVYNHPSYGGVLSGFAVAEIIKNYAALGLTAPIYFYRDTAHKHVELVIKGSKGWVPVGFLSQKMRPMKETIRHTDVLIKIGGPCEDIVFISDGTLAVETTSYPVVAATAI